jgi:hypothetical protein
MSTDFIFEAVLIFAFWGFGTQRTWLSDMESLHWPAHFCHSIHWSRLNQGRVRGAGVRGADYLAATRSTLGNEWHSHQGYWGKNGMKKMWVELWTSFFKAVIPGPIVASGKK